MKIIFITGSHPRHAYLARKIAETGYLDTVIIEQRESFIPEPPANIPEDLKKLFIHHFNERDRVETEMFGSLNWPECNLKNIKQEQLNSALVQKLLITQKPDLLLTYGCHMLTEETLQCVQGEKWNCHGGLSPWYKGAVTHFWPSYMLEPQMTGMTVHHLTKSLDAGDVVHQCVADLIPKDTLHKLAARALLKLGIDLPKLIKKLEQDGPLQKSKAYNYRYALER